MESPRIIVEFDKSPNAQTQPSTVSVRKDGFDELGEYDKRLFLALAREALFQECVKYFRNNLRKYYAGDND